jgi:hypothetical protein
MNLFVTDQDSESQLTKDSLESGQELWSEKTYGNLDTPKTSLEESPSTPKEVPDLSNQIVSLPPQLPPPISDKGKAVGENQPHQLPGKAYNVYTNEQRYAACVAFVIYGRADRVSEVTGVSIRTVYNWIKSDWWPRMLQDAKREHQELIESRLSHIVEKVTEQLLDRLEYGEIKVHNWTDRKGANHSKSYRVPVSARDLDNLGTHFLDKLRTLRNQPTKLTATAIFDPLQMARKFASVAEEVRDKIVVDDRT